MKLAPIYLCIASAIEEKKVPPRHPLQRLNRLVQFSAEILTSGAFQHMPHGNKWSKESNDKWITMWTNKFAKNAGRMERNFQRGNQRCGFYDPNM